MYKYSWPLFAFIRERQSFRMTHREERLIKQSDSKSSEVERESLCGVSYQKRVLNIVRASAYKFLYMYPYFLPFVSFYNR